jgi:hypothetical protein
MKMPMSKKLHLSSGIRVVAGTSSVPGSVHGNNQKKKNNINRLTVIGLLLSFLKI